MPKKKKEQERIEMGEGFFYPDEKKYCFMKRSAADVDVKDESGSIILLIHLDLETLRILD